MDLETATPIRGGAGRGGGPREPLTVVLTGAECTGKTSLAAHLAARFALPWVPEAARRYAERVARELTAADVEPIAREHLRLAEAVRAQGGPLLLLDTDLVSTVVYARQYYGACPEWIGRAARARRADLYLLHRPDIPWIPEPGVRADTDQRPAQDAAFRELLDGLRVSWIEIRGGREERERRAAAAIRGLLAAFGLPGW